MKKAINIQDISNELGLSRNTVSKALNGHDVPQKTRDLVLQKAIQMGYKGLDIASTNSEYLRNQKILLLTSKPLYNLIFFLSIVRGVEATVKKYDFELLQYTYSASTTYKDLSNYVKLFDVDGIICIESFELEFIREILELNVPIAFIDFPIQGYNITGNYDIIMMENAIVIGELVSQLIQCGYQRFGFIGDYKHCRGFYERFTGLRDALYLNQLPFYEDYNILLDDSFPYGNSDLLREAIERLPALPECFFCANDSIAVSAIQALTKMGYNVPNDIAVVGFDNIGDGRVSTPPLTTISIDKEYLGKQALVTLLHRIKNPNDKQKTVYVKTNIIHRLSTKIKGKRVRS